jgi:hypothetical protein
MPGPADIARRTMESVNASGSASEAIAALEPLIHPDIEWVNPHDAIEGGTRRGLSGMRLVFDNFFAGFGASSTMEFEGVEERGDRALIVLRPQIRGESSGVDVPGPEIGAIFTVRDGLLLKIEWHYDVGEARARFGKDG